MLLLPDLCSGMLKSPNVIIEDGVEVPGRCLILALLHSLCKRYNQVLLFTSERRPQFFENALPAECRRRLKVIDFHKLPRPSYLENRCEVRPLITTTHRCIEGSDQRVGVVFDSLARWLFTHTSATTIPILVKSLLEYTDRGNKVDQVVSLVTRGVHDEHSIQLVCSGATTFIRLETPSSHHHQLRAVISHGEMFEEPKEYIEEFNVDTDLLQVVNVTAVSDVDPKKITSKGLSKKEAELDPVSRLTSELTFNLSLKPEEKAAKDHVVLPYTLLTGQQFSSGDSSRNIHYIPDEADDFDDEDPDEDLDF